MAEIINIPDFGEVRLSLKEYNEMRDEISLLRYKVETLTKERDEICDENKVRVRRQIIKVTELTTNPRALGQQEIIEDKLENCEDLKKEIDDKIHECEEGWMKKADELQENLDRAEKTFEQCQRQKLDAELELQRLKGRNWWQRLWNM